MPSLIYGSVVLASMNPVLPFAQLKGGISGQHAEGKYRGIWHHRITGDSHTESELALTQRDKYMRISTEGLNHEKVNALIREQMTDLDSRFTEIVNERGRQAARHLFKLQSVMQQIPISYGPYLTVINDVSPYGSIALMTHGQPMYLIGIYDTVNTSIRIVWTNDQKFENDVRQTAPTRYVFYRFPIIEDRPLFMHTQNLCARWYDWNKAFQGTDGILRAFNVAETVLFRDPTVPSFIPGVKRS